MAKVPFSKLQTSIDNSVTNNIFYDKNGKEVIYGVKHYLPFNEKLEMITKIINQSIDDNGFYNPMRVKLYSTLEIVYAYTNLSFTEKQKEDPFKLYDLFVSTGVFKDILNSIGDDELSDIYESIKTTIDNIYKYKNSALGILESITTDYSALNLEASDIQEKLANEENLGLLKDVLSKLG